MSNTQFEQINQLKRLMAINRALTTSLDFADVLRQIAVSASELVSAKYSLVLLANEDRTLIVRASSGCDESALRDFAEPIEEAVVEKLRERLGLASAETLAAAPVMSDHTVDGMLVVAGAQFNSDEQWLLGALADQAAIALRNARLHEMEVAAAERERDDTRRVLRETEDRYRLMVEEVKDYAIFLIDLDGHIATWNMGAQRIFGYREAEALGQSAAIIFTPEDRARRAPEQELRQAIETGRSEDERWHLRQDGSRFWASGIATRLTDERGAITGFVKIARDYTERKLAEEERERLLTSEQAARQQAEDASRLKDEFLATVSHELRTPLNAIIGWVQLLREGKLGAADAAHALEIIHRSSKSQAQLIEDILDVARIVTGRVRLDIRPLKLPVIIDHALDAVRMAAAAKNIALQTAIDPRAEMVVGDSERLQQVVWNLLSNAVKFTPEGGRVCIETRQLDGHIELSVSDTGQGIAPAFLPYVFERFRQADSSSTRRHGGLGLGLSIVRHLLELHGGSVRAESPGVDQGTTFTIRLPISGAAATAESTEAPPPVARALHNSTSLPHLAGVRILLVDDQPDTLEMLATIFKQCASEVRTACSAEAALQALEEWRPDAIISDIGMPEQDGYSLLKAVRQLPAERGGRTPAVALTAYTKSEDRIRALAAGFQTHLGKPVEPAELLTLVASLVGRR